MKMKDIMKKQADTTQDLVHTSTIGAIGVGSSYLTSRILNGAKTLAQKSKNNKAAIIGGGLGLIGDYAAVKLNKGIDAKMNKVASENKYLEKVAEMYSVKGHPGIGDGIYKTPNLMLERDQYRQYANDTEGSMKPVVGGLGLGALAGAAGYTFAKNRGGRPGVAGTITGLAGYYLGKHMGQNSAHSSALENLGIMHPYLLEDE
jgi:hypothetical protein